MDPATLAAAVTSLLVPFLAKAGSAIVDHAASALPGAAANLSVLVTKYLETKPAAAAIVTDLVKNPSDQDQQAAFALQLKMALKNDPEFAAAVEDMVKKATADQPGGHNVTVTTGNISGVSDSSIAIGSNATSKKG